MKVALFLLVLSASTAMAKPAGDCWMDFGQSRINNLTRQIYLEHQIPVAIEGLRIDSQFVPKFGSGNYAYEIRMQATQMNINDAKKELADLKIKAKDLHEKFEQCQKNESPTSN